MKYDDRDFYGGPDFWQFITDQRSALSAGDETVPPAAALADAPADDDRALAVWLKGHPVQMVALIEAFEGLNVDSPSFRDFVIAQLDVEPQSTQEPRAVAFLQSVFTGDHDALMTEVITRPELARGLVRLWRDKLTADGLSEAQVDDLIRGHWAKA
jgi:hypothetical protein